MSHSAPTITVVIPAFNRVKPLELCLRSVRQAAAKVPTEVIVVDDGSEPPLADSLSRLVGGSFRIIRQPNQGSIVARNTGLAASAGEFVQFLDSDDLVHPDKFTRQTDAMRAAEADISYSDMACYTLGAGEELNYFPGDRLRQVADPVEFLMRVQPVPHSAIYRRDYLSRYLASPLVSARREFDPVGDVWIYFNLLPYPARLVKVSEALTAIGVHEENRYSRHWERLGLAALRLMEEFFIACPRTPETLVARIAAGECAFEAWRRLPKDFHPEFDARMLRVWQQAPRGPLSRLGGRQFQILACVIGPANAGRLLRKLRGHSYASCSTISGEEYQQLFGC